MKRLALIAAVISSSAVLAEQTLEEAKKQLEIAQANYNAALERTSKITQEISTTQKEAEKIVGKPEANTKTEEYNEKLKALIKENNDAVDACKAKLKSLEEQVAVIGKQHTVVPQGTQLTVEKAQPKPEAPRPDMPRQPYATKGATYPRMMEQ